MFKSEAKVNHLIHVQDNNMLQLVLVIKMRYSEWSTSKYVAFEFIPHKKYSQFITIP